MALTIPQVLRQFKADVGKAIAADTILQICGYLNWRMNAEPFAPRT